MNKAVWIVVGVACTTLTACNTVNGPGADGLRHNHRSVAAVSGQKTRIGINFKTNGNCGVDQQPDVTVIKPPQHGKIDTQTEAGYTHFTNANARCNTQKMPGMATYYTSAPGYSGKDKVVTRVSFRDGRVDEDTVDINVVK